jgi:hypothetical protein
MLWWPIKSANPADSTIKQVRYWSDQFNRDLIALGFRTTERNPKSVRWPRKVTILANDVKATHDEQSQLARALDLILEAYAIVLRYDRELALLATATALALGERLELSDETVHHMQESAAAEGLRKQR